MGDLQLFDIDECSVELDATRSEEVAALRALPIHEQLRKFNLPDVIYLYENDRDARRLLADLDLNRLASETSNAIHYAVSRQGNANLAVQEQIKLLDSGVRKNLGGDIETNLGRGMGWDEGESLDFRVGNLELECKWSLTNAWMIGKQQQGELCLMICLADSGFNVGVFRALPEYLGKANQDKKRSLSAEGREHVLWLIHDGNLPLGDDSVTLFLDRHLRELTEKYGSKVQNCVNDGNVSGSS